MVNVDRTPDTVVRGAIGILTGREHAERATGDIRIRAGRIVDIGTIAPEPEDVTLDARGCVVYPGLVNTHHHLFQSVLKGVRAGLNAPLETWAREVLARHWHRLDAGALEVAATIGMAELLLSGTTTIADHHFLFSDTYGYEPADIIFDVAQRLGLRLVFCRGGSTQAQDAAIRGVPPMPVEPLHRMIARVDDLATRYHDPAPAAMRRIVFAPSLPFWSVLPAELAEIAVAARAIGTLLHTHVSETTVSIDYCRETYGKRPIPWLAEHGWLGPDVWFAHLVHVDASELRLLAQTGTGMAHCPQSNCRLGAGIAPAPALERLGGRVALAVDGAASNEAADMSNEMHCAWLLHRAAGETSAIRAEDVVRWATSGGAAVLGLPEIGTVEVGQAADLAIFDLGGLRYAGLHDPLVGPVICGGGGQVRHVLVGGRPIVVDGAIPGLDLPALTARALAVVRRLAN